MLSFEVARQQVLKKYGHSSAKEVLGQPLYRELQFELLKVRALRLLIAVLIIGATALLLWQAYEFFAPAYEAYPDPYRPGYGGAHLAVLAGLSIALGLWIEYRPIIEQDLKGKILENALHPAAAAELSYLFESWKGGDGGLPYNGTLGIRFLSSSEVIGNSWYFFAFAGRLSARWLIGRKANHARILIRQVPTSRKNFCHTKDFGQGFSKRHFVDLSLRELVLLKDYISSLPVAIKKKRALLEAVEIKTSAVEIQARSAKRLQQQEIVTRVLKMRLLEDNQAGRVKQILNGNYGTLRGIYSS